MKRALLLLPLLAACHDWDEGYTRCVNEGRCGAGIGGGSAGGGGSANGGGGAATGGGSTGGGGTGGSGGGGGGPSAALSWGTLEHDAGTLEPGLSLQAQLTLTNLGDLRSAVPMLTLVDDAGVFSVTATGCGSGLDPSGFCAPSLTFAPTAPGTFRASLIARETVSGSMATLSLVGVGRLADLPVTVRRTGTGAGRIDVVNPPMTSCAEDAGCTYLVPRGSTVQLAAVPSESELGGWSGACSSTSANCSFTVTEDAGATATVQLLLWAQVSVGISPAGLPGARVVSEDGGIDCPGSCSQRFAPDASVLLRAAPTLPSTRSVRFTSQPGAACASADAGACGFVIGTTDVFVDAGFIGTNYFFPTSVALPMNLTRSDYNQACANFASDAGLFGGSWAAVLSTSGNQVPSVFTNRRGYIRPDGKPVMDTIDPNVTHIFYPPRIDERGNDLWANDGGLPLVATGAGATGCFNWDMSGTSGAASAGSASAGRLAWYTNNSSVQCIGVGRIYCAQYAWDNPLRVPLPTPDARFAFVTRVGNIGFTDADPMCQFDATSAGYDGGVYRALRATTSASALARVRLDAGMWVRPDGLPLAESMTDFVAGKLAVPFNLSIDKIEASTAHGWTGAPALAVPAPGASSNCNNWMSDSTAYFGLVVETSPVWFSSSTDACGAGNRYFCLQE